MFFTDNFKKFWKKNKNSKNFDKDLRFITEKFINSNSYNFVSNQWQKLNINDYKTIQKYGLTKYGSKISTHYIQKYYYNLCYDMKFSLINYVNKI